MSRETKHTIACYCLLILPIIGFFVFTLYPLLWSTQKAFTFYDGIPKNTRFTGMENFLDIFKTDGTYWNSWLTTLEYTAFKVCMEVPLAFIISLILKQKIFGKGFFRTAYFMPHLIGVAIIGVVFSNLFNYQGYVNGVLMKLGYNPVDFFGQSKHTALFVLAIGSTWHTCGVNILYFTSALSTVSEDVYESAKIDGAGLFVRIFKITIPMIIPMVMTILLLSINGTLHTNDYIIALTGGAPFGKTHTVMSYITKTYAPGFAGGSVNLGYGCALSVVTSIMLCIFAKVYSSLKAKLEDIY